jgi:AAA domain
MPVEASKLAAVEPWLRVLLMGAAKVGKTTSAIASLSEIGPGYVIACGDESGLRPAARRTKKFTYDLVRDANDMEAALKEARKAVKEGRSKWTAVDDFSLYASWLETALRDESAQKSTKGEADGRKYWPEYKSRILNIARRLMDVPAHLVFITHFIEQSQEIEGQRAKAGTGIVPLIGGSAREELPALFIDVLFMEKVGGKRVFQVNPEGVWGPGCRSVDGTTTIGASFIEFLKAAKDTATKRS